jgi:hypothetical protein
LYCCRCNALAVAAIDVVVHVSDVAVAAIGVVVHDSVFAATHACTTVDAVADIDVAAIGDVVYASVVADAAVGACTAVDVMHLLLLLLMFCA